MTSLPAAFPQRPVRVIKSGVTPARSHVITALVLFALVIGGAIWVGPNLVRDFIIQADPVEVPEADIRNGECSTYRGIVTSCGADIAYEIKGKSVRASLHYLFLDPSDSDYQVSVVRSASHPAMATLSLGLDMLWNRAIVAGVIGLALLVGGLAVLSQARRAAKFNKSIGEPVVLVPVVATVALSRKLLFGLLGISTTVRYSLDGKKQLSASTVFRGKQRAFELGKAGKKTFVLGAVPRQGGMLIQLDAGLQRVDFTDAERAAIQHAVIGEAAAA